MEIISTGAACAAAGAINKAAVRNVTRTYSSPLAEKMFTNRPIRQSHDNPPRRCEGPVHFTKAQHDCFLSVLHRT